MEDSYVLLLANDMRRLDNPKGSTVLQQPVFMEADTELVKSLKNGNQPAFEELIHKYKDRIYRIVFTFIQDKTEADDVTQEVFLKVYRKINTFKEQSSFFTWLYSVTINECQHSMRKTKREFISLDAPLSSENAATLVDILKSEEQNPDTMLINEEQIALLHKMINLLPTKYRTVYILKTVDGLSYKEISEILGISMEKVKIWLFRAREKLDDKMRPFYEEFSYGGK
ncbi:MAG: sigma-70 family RNA polymerase sigma factor [Elusimicrobiota bacterium]